MVTARMIGSFGCQSTTKNVVLNIVTDAQLFGTIAHSVPAAVITVIVTTGRKRLAPASKIHSSGSDRARVTPIRTHESVFARGIAANIGTATNPQRTQSWAWGSPGRTAIIFSPPLGACTENVPTGASLCRVEMSRSSRRFPHVQVATARRVRRRRGAARARPHPRRLGDRLGRAELPGAVQVRG